MFKRIAKQFKNDLENNLKQGFTLSMDIKGEFPQTPLSLRSYSRKNQGTIDIQDFIDSNYFFVNSTI